MEDEFEILLVRDSVVLGELIEFFNCSLNSYRIHHFCYPGARLDDITELSHVTSES